MLMHRLLSHVAYAHKYTLHIMSVEYEENGIVWISIYENTIIYSQSLIHLMGVSLRNKTLLIVNFLYI